MIHVLCTWYSSTERHSCVPCVQISLSHRPPLQTEIRIEWLLDLHVQSELDILPLVWYARRTLIYSARELCMKHIRDAEMHSVDSTESRENKTKKSSSKMLPPLGSEPRAYNFTVLHTTRENSSIPGHFFNWMPAILYSPSSTLDVTILSCVVPQRNFVQDKFDYLTPLPSFCALGNAWLLLPYGW